MAEWADLSDLEGDGASSRPKRINCFKCVHFRVSWDPKFPRACALFGFAGPELPSATVLKTTGRPCPAFEAKKTPTNS